jgi:hypothetical protein
VADHEVLICATESRRLTTFTATFNDPLAQDNSRTKKRELPPQFHVQKRHRLQFCLELQAALNIGQNSELKANELTN